MKKIPEQLLGDLQHVPGFEKEAFLAEHESAPPVSVRIHPVKNKGILMQNEHVPWCAAGKYLAERPVFTLDPLFHAGAYYVQEASSMFLDHLLRDIIADRKGLRILDLCAAPGGKSTLIASILDKDSLLVSNEVIRSRATILEENMTRWGYMNTWVTSNDPNVFSKLKGYFDIIVVDAPCSGSGMFRKDEKAIDEWSEDNVALCAERQKRILKDVWPSLKEGGALVYSTCSYSVEEDEDIVDFLAGNYRLTSVGVSLKEEWSVVETRSQKYDLAGYRFYPNKVKGEGFFIAVVRKNEESGVAKQVKFKSAHDKKAYEQCSYLLDKEFTCLKGKDEYIAITPEHEYDLQVLQEHLYLRKAGVALGVPSKKEWLPSHAVALSINASKALPKVEMNKEQALKFLKKEDPNIDGLGKGWYIATYEGYCLGWLKALGNRINNYLPKNWRIRMEINDADWA